MTASALRSRTVIWLLTLGFALVAHASPPLRAQQRPAAPAGLETIQIRPNVYVIFGAGGNITAQVGEDGVVLVDSGNGTKSADVIAAIKALTPKPIRLIVDTSLDNEFTGGNESVGRAGVEVNPDAFSDDPHATVLAHENVLLRMSADEKTYPSNRWPSETFTSRVRTMYINDAPLVVMRQLGAISDGDSLVMLRNADVIATGDILDMRHFPVIDPARGGSIQGELDALQYLLEITVPAMPFVLKPGKTLVVPGHGRISDYAELVEYRDMLTIIRDNIADLVKKGQTLAQVQAANPTAGYRKRFGAESGPWTTEKFVEVIYNELKKGKS